MWGAEHRVGVCVGRLSGGASLLPALLLQEELCRKNYLLMFLKQSLLLPSIMHIHLC